MAVDICAQPTIRSRVTMRTAARAAVASFLLSTGVFATSADAQTLTEAERAARADLVTRAQAAQRAGQFEEALGFIERAERIGPTAGTRFVTARVHFGAGRPLAALTSAEQCVRDVDLDTQTTAANRDALRQACQALRDELAARVGQVTVRVAPGAPLGLVVRLAGEVVRPASYNTPQRVVAGTVRVEASFPGRSTWSRDVLVQGGAIVALDVPTTPDAPPASATPRPTAGPAARPSASSVAVLAPPSPTADAPRAAGGTQRALGVAGLVLGGVGLAVGAVAGGVLSSMSESYANNRCAYAEVPSQVCRDDYGTMEVLHPLQWAGYVGGGVIAATGLIVLLTAPSRAPAVHVSLAPGAGSIVYGGSF